MPLSKVSLSKSLSGNSIKSLSRSDAKLVVFTSLAGILTFIVSIIYFLICIQFNINFDKYLAFAIAVISLLAIYINKKGFHNSARIILIIGADTTICLSTLVDPIDTGTGMLFIIVFIGSIVGFGLKNIKITVILTIFTAFTTVISILDLPFDRQTYTTDYLEFIFRVNFIVTIIMSAFLVYLLTRLNYRSETSLKKSKLQVQDKNNELAKVNSELDRFVYSASHDLKSPISSVRGLINVAKLTDDHIEIKSYLDMMEGRLIHLDKFISDIASYSRNARQTLNLSRVPLKVLIENYLHGLEYLLSNKSINVKIEVPDDLVMISDETRLEMVLGNIISNAFKYFDPSKDNSFVNIRSTINGLGIQIEIEDNGIGIPSDYLHKIFDMFVRAHDKAKGAGLGLYIVKETLEKLNGTIEVRSEVDIGSKFIITLPMEYESEAFETLLM
jgi:signal transduction histidine kinase